MHSFYLDAIRNFEGYQPQAVSDYAQLSNGYGTKARFAGEVIDKTEAEQRFRAEVSKARSVVEQAAPQADEGTKAALTSLTYNTGTAWLGSGLGDAVRSGDLVAARDIFQKYNKAGGEVLPGLVSRRAQEALWIGNPEAVGAPGSAFAAGTDSTQALPPVIVADAGQAAAASDGDVAGAGRGFATDTANVAVLGRGPRVERGSQDGSVAKVADDMLAALAGLDQLASGGNADIARLANLKRGSELAKPNQDRDNKDRDTVRI